MRRLALTLAAALSLAPLAACSTLSPDAAQTAPQALADAEKALTLAHLAYQGIGVALKDAAASGALHGADAATARTLYDQAGAILDVADQADAAANAQGVLDAVAAAAALIVQLHALVPN
ncbi:MAG: hypothetical protein WDM91_13905 [Rhizomicrobium sp.]